MFSFYCHLLDLQLGSLLYLAESLYKSNTLGLNPSGEKVQYVSSSMDGDILYVGKIFNNNKIKQ